MHFAISAAITALLGLLPTTTTAHPPYTPPLHRRQAKVPVLSPSTRYSEQVFTGTHHSAMLRTKQNSFSLSGNQFYNITVQLDAGIRLLHGQTYLVDNDIHICHSACQLLDGGLLTTLLSEVSAWLGSNEGEIVTMSWVNPDGNVPLGLLNKAYSATKLDSLSFIPPHAVMRVEDWPTIEEMVLAERRVVTFIDNGADQAKVPYILDQRGYLAETSERVTNPAAFTCSTGDDSASVQPGNERLGLVNHLLYEDQLRQGQRYPNVASASETNAATGQLGALLAHLDSCASAWGRLPNFALVDFFDRGDVFLAQDIVNGLVPHPAGTQPPTSLRKGATSPGPNPNDPNNKFITLNELSLERQREQELVEFEKEVDDGRRKNGLNPTEELPVFTFTRTVPKLVRETEGVVNAGAPDPNDAGFGRRWAVKGSLVGGVWGALGWVGMVVALGQLAIAV